MSVEEGPTCKALYGGNIMTPAIRPQLVIIAKASRNEGTPDPWREDCRKSGTQPGGLPTVLSLSMYQQVLVPMSYQPGSYTST